jgi:hypothetical protein
MTIETAIDQTQTRLQIQIRPRLHYDDAHDHSRDDDAYCHAHGDDELTSAATFIASVQGRVHNVDSCDGLAPGECDGLAPGEASGNA